MNKSKNNDKTLRDLEPVIVLFESFLVGWAKKTEFTQGKPKPTKTYTERGLQAIQVISVFQPSPTLKLFLAPLDLFRNIQTWLQSRGMATRRNLAGLDYESSAASS